MPFIKINNNNIFYNITGNGFPLILLHDGFYNTSSWDSVRNKLAEYFKVIDYDRFGYGRSDKYTDKINGDIIKLYSDELEEFIDALGLSGFHICGHCLGGAIALHYTLNNPLKVKKIITESVGYFSDHKLLVKSDWTFRPFEQIDPELKKDLIKINGEKYAEYFWEIISSYKTNYIMSENYNILPKIKKIKHPVLLINGDRDFYFDVEHAVTAFNSFKNAHLWISPDTGHAPHIERSAEFIENIIRFLNK